ncbi:MAG: BON domain-containing protein [Armatimonadetes bacterium]|nr:BON domain-containing protein [Armatimonadota bacterium]
MQKGMILARRPVGATACGLLAALALTGCNNNPPETPPTNTVVTTNPAPPAGTTTTVTPGAATTTTSAAPTGPDTKINTNAGPGTSNGTDAATADAVNAAIVHNKQMTGSRVEAVVTNGVARLNGTVQNQQQKALAATTASKTPGVSSVINKLTIIATGGAHAKPKTIVKVFNHTTVVHDKQYVPVPVPSDKGNDNANGNGGNSDNGAGNDNGTSDNSGKGSNDKGGNGDNTQSSGSNP